MTARSLDLRGTPCPVNFIRCKLTLESMQPGDQLAVRLDRGEPEAMVIPGLRDAGHAVVVNDEATDFVSLLVTCASG